MWLTQLLRENPSGQNCTNLMFHLASALQNSPTMQPGDNIVLSRWARSIDSSLSLLALIFYINQQNTKWCKNPALVTMPISHPGFFSPTDLDLRWKKLRDHASIKVSSGQVRWLEVRGGEDDSNSDELVVKEDLVDSRTRLVPFYD